MIQYEHLTTGGIARASAFAFSHSNRCALDWAFTTACREKQAGAVDALFRVLRGMA